MRGVLTAFSGTRWPPGDSFADLTATATLTALAPGVLDVAWSTEPGTALDFFGITRAPGVTVTSVPEPTTAGLLAFGLVVLLRRAQSGT